MPPQIAQWIRISKRLTEAVGFLELGMPEKALERLENLGPLGPFAADVERLRGEAYRLQHRDEEAARSFQAAAKLRAAQRQKPHQMTITITFCPQSPRQPPSR